MPNINEKIIQDLSRKQIKASIVSIERLSVLKEEIADTLMNKITDSDFAEYVNGAYNFNSLNDFPDAKSIIIAAKYNPIQKVLFNWDGQLREIIIPAGFVNFIAKQTLLQKEVADTIHSHDFHIKRIILPIKLLATRSGLAVYGRNNICYINGMGSFHYLASFLCDLPIENDFWQETSSMDICSECLLCENNCPTNALEHGRFLIHGERCITLYNRNPGEFPEWIDPKWHNSLFGCTKCQDICPVNKEFVNNIPIIATFSSDETSELLRLCDTSNLSSKLRSKLDELGFPELHAFLARNLKVLLVQ